MYISVELLNELLAICELGNNEDIQKQPYERFGMFETSLSFIGATNVSNFYSTLEILHGSIKEIQDTLSEKSFKEIIVNDLREHKIKNTVYTKDDIQQLTSRVKGIPLSNYKILREVQGISIGSNAQFSKECFTIYYWPIAKQIIESNLDIAPEFLWLDHTHSYLIEVEILARDNDKAIERANRLFELFTYFLHVQMGRFDNKCYVSIVQQRFANYEHIYCFKDKQISNKINLTDFFEPVPIDDEFFSERSPFDNMWKLIASNNTQLEKRLVLALSWLGQAYREDSVQNGFLKAAISLEIIFTHNENTIVNSSILSQIAESIALILGKDAEERIAIEKEMKELYSIRSAIAHAGKDNISIKKFYLICSYARAIILELTSNSEYKVSKINDLYDVLKRKKYSA